MDKYEYKICLEEIDSMISEGNFEGAAEIADTIDWSKVRSVSTLCKISDLYKINGRYEESIALLNLGYDKYPTGRDIIYALCELELKVGHLIKALQYNAEFARLFPEDPGKFILTYKIYKTQGASLPERIHVLEKLKSCDFRAKWGYELAELYKEAGESGKCRSLCEEIAATFGEGTYVRKAKELADGLGTETVQPAAVSEPVSAMPETVRKEEILPEDTAVPEVQIEPEIPHPDVLMETADLHRAIAEGVRSMEKASSNGRQFEGMMAQETNGQYSMAIEEEPAPEKQITGQLDIQTIMEEWKRVREEQEKQRVAQIRQRVLEDTGPILQQFEETTKQGILEDMEREISREERRNAVDLPEELEYEDLTEAGDKDTLVRDRNVTKEWKPRDIRKAEERAQLVHMTMIAAEEARAAEKAAENALYDEEQANLCEEEAYSGADPDGEDAYYDAVDEDGYGTEEDYAEEMHPEEPAEYAEEAGGDLNREEPEDVPEEAHREDVPAEEMTAGESAEEAPEVRSGEIPEEESYDEEDRMEDAAAGYYDYAETAEHPEEENTPDQISHAEEITEEAELEEAADTEQEPETVYTEEIPEEEYEEETAVSPETEEEYEEPEEEADAEEHHVRTLSEEERKLFRPYLQSGKTRRQIMGALDGVTLAPYTGNIIITCSEGMEAMSLARVIVKYIRMTDQNFSGKVAKTTGAVINRKDLSKALDQIKNGALLIEKASGMNEQSVEMLHRELENETRGLMVIIMDSAQSMDQFLEHYGDLKEHFTGRIDLKTVNNDMLVDMASEYAREQGYSIEEFAILALHKRFAELQTIDHSISPEEVRELIDAAIRHASRKTLGSLFRKKHDADNLIILYEKDFLHS